MKLLNKFGLYTKGQYIAVSKIFRAQGQQEGRLKERQKVAQTIVAMQVKVDEMETKYNDIKCYKLDVLNKEISELERLSKRVKSPRKRKKIATRIDKLRIKLLDII